MFVLLLFLLTTFLIAAVLRVFFRANRSAQILAWTAFSVRILAVVVVQNIPFFTHAARGDCVGYEDAAELVSRIWERSHGFHFVSNVELPILGSAVLPVNVFAVVVYFNGGPTSFGCTEVVIALATLSSLILYRVIRDLGVGERTAFRCALAFALSPGFVYYTSDSYKDGFVVFLVLLSLACSMQLSMRFTLFGLIASALAGWALWYVRPYLVFASLLPLAVGLLGLDHPSATRKLLLFALALVALALLPLLGQEVDAATGAADELFERGTSRMVRTANGHMGGSVVLFEDDGSAYGALPLKIVYTLFAPFPWMVGTVGLNVGKVDALINAFFFVRALMALKVHWATRKGIVLSLLAFIVPLTFVYALGMANIGLIARQRMPIGAALIVLGSLSWLRNEKPEEPQTEFRRGFLRHPPPRSRRLRPALSPHQRTPS